MNDILLQLCKLTEVGLRMLRSDKNWHILKISKLGAVRPCVSRDS